MAFAFKSAMMLYSAQHYNPIVGAFIRKYSSHVKRDINEISDDKKKYFYIDTSQYMNYTNAELSDEYHVHHGPQPVSKHIALTNASFKFYRKESQSTPHGS